MFAGRHISLTVEKSKNYTYCIYMPNALNCNTKSILGSNMGYMDFCRLSKIVVSNLGRCVYREYIHSVAIYQKYLTRLGEFIIFEPWPKKYPSYIILFLF